jgi:hypothetical protein
MKLLLILLTVLVLSGCRINRPQSTAFTGWAALGPGDTTRGVSESIQPTINPEPSTMVLLGIGLAGIAVYMKRRLP